MAAARAGSSRKGFPETEPAARHARAALRSDEALAWLNNDGQTALSPMVKKPHTELAEQFDVGMEGFTSNLSAERYREMIQRAVEYIHAGDVFQVNLAQRLLSPAKCDSIELYLTPPAKQSLRPTPAISIWATPRFAALRPSVF